MNVKSRKTKSSEEQTVQAPSEEDFVGLVKYISEREKNLSKYSDKLRQNLQRIFDEFGSAHYCKLCGAAEDNTKHIRYRSEQGYLKRERKETINGITVTHPANVDYSHAFQPKIAVSLDLIDEENFAQTRVDDLNWEYYRLEYYRLGTRNSELVIIGSTGKDLTEECTWTTTPNASRATPTREELKALVRSGRLPKFLALVAKKLQQAEAEYCEVSAIAEKMAKSIEPQDVAQNTNAILQREGAEEVGQ